MIKRLLVANRGEIAVRIIGTAHKLGIDTVAVYSEADKDAMHVAVADQAELVGPAPSSESYLNIEAIIEAAKRSGADAIHPGYGFLSEKAAFAEAVEAAGLTFVGPTAKVITQMGDKSEARRIALEHHVPVTAGYNGAEQDASRLKEEAERIGTPFMIKATAGGGGRGMRRVESQANFDECLASAKREALSAFGDDTVMLERLIERARHVEVQVLADTHGTILHLGERDCSAQRRHQKVIEEAPCPTINNNTRNKLHEAAIRLARAVEYTGAGTVEFLIDDEENIYFLEMNTRLQVEHPVTELVTATDLVAEQIRIAGGEKLSFKQEDIGLKGHAVEVRLYAEDPANGFMPQTGTLGHLKLAAGPDVRLDTGVEEGHTVGPHYDPMLAKIIAYGDTREQARTKLVKSLKQSRVAGLTTNKAYLTKLLETKEFRSAELRTSDLDNWQLSEDYPDQFGAIIAGSILLTDALEQFPNPDLAGWRTNHDTYSRYDLEIGEQRHALTIRHKMNSQGWQFEVQSDGEAHHLQISKDANTYTTRINGTHYRAAAFKQGPLLHIDLGDYHYTATDVTHIPPALNKMSGNGQLQAPMDGQVVAIHKTENDAVMDGDLILVIEAMKMEHQIRADQGGHLNHLNVSVGDQVKSKQLLGTISVEEGQEA